MEQVKKKRGRPRKNPIPEVPEEIQNIIQEVQQKQEELQQQINEELPLPQPCHKLHEAASYHQNQSGIMPQVLPNQYG